MTKKICEENNIPKCHLNSPTTIFLSVLKISQKCMQQFNFDSVQEFTHDAMTRKISNFPVKASYRSKIHEFLETNLDDTLLRTF